MSNPRKAAKRQSTERRLSCPHARNAFPAALHPEYLEEMAYRRRSDRGRGRGAQHRRGGHRRRQLLAEVETLPGVSATPTGLEGLRFKLQPQKMPEPPMAIARLRGHWPATADGKIVFGHITMFNLYAANFFNVWLGQARQRPPHAHAVVPRRHPSAMDYY